MKLLAWNILAGGGSRRDRMVEEISAYDPDVIALTQFRAKPGVALIDALSERGWPLVETTNPTGIQGGIAVFSRTPIERIRPSPAPAEHRLNWLDLHLPEYDLGVSIFHILAAVSNDSKAAKVRFWDALLKAAEKRLHQRFLFVGDWNTGVHHQDEAGKTYYCAGQFVRLSEMGWTDLWRKWNPGPTEWTWYSKPKAGVRGNGFRVDHAFATPSLSRHVTSCRYSHREREAGISDHSIMIVEVE